MAQSIENEQFPLLLDLEYLNGKLEGDSSLIVSKIAKIEEARMV